MHFLDELIAKRKSIRSFESNFFYKNPIEGQILRYPL